ncbi:sensor histidine kinase [Paenibacillus segetis]|uniref:histidine kinase n=1 Tax=Paenibacillus segetis TaxID=1325360 RepID=A0ABQ1YR11_9BACL|nr:ATP-binding protein [Paenibacillus segetis]GGH34327.1 two-component sensor histidine kinase [Paenibacillus segetis]
MLTLAIIVIIVLVIIIYLQHRAKSVRSAQINKIGERLEVIMADKSGEKLLLFTSDPALQVLMTKMNALLEMNLKSIAENAKSQIMVRKMLSNISHDLKTPLTVVFGYVEALALNQDMSTEERQELLSKVHQKTSQTIHLIDTFFNLAKLESGDTAFPLTRLDMSELCRVNILQFYDMLATKGFEVHIDIPDHAAFALGNEDAINRVLNNLISNAIRYGADGKTLGLKLYEEQDEVCVVVWDRGQGVRDSHKNFVFERMYTLDDSRNKAVQGSGLGLTIAKRLIETMGGSIHLSSKPYEKTEFLFRLKKVKMN